MHRIFPVVIALTSSILSAQVSINGYKYFQVKSKNDYLAILGYASSILQKDGLKPVNNIEALEPKERLKVLGLQFEYWDRTRQVVSPKGCKIIAYDAFSGRQLLERSGASTWGGITNRGVAESAFKDAWSAFNYKGYKEADYETNLKELFPARPKVMINVEAFKNTDPTAPIEGVWSFDNNAYQVVITKDESGRYGDFIGVVINTEVPIWQRDEIKFEFRSTATETVFTGNAYRADKSRYGATFVLKGTMIEWVMERPDGQRENALLIRNWPRVASTAEISRRAMQTGTGFLVGLDGVLATNHHVIEDGTSIKVLFPLAKKEYEATVALQDRKNDIALLHLKGFNPYDIGVTRLPYKIMPSTEAKVGDRVYTLGFPLQNVLGSAAKFTDGSLSSKSGIQDDPTYMQISAPIQPGNSGGPLLGPNGQLVGIVVASLNADWMQRKFGIVPQNINFAIKAEYLLSLIEMLPTPPNRDNDPKSSPEQVGKAVAFVQVTLK